jgi:hypothetical protein
MCMSSPKMPETPTPAAPPPPTKKVKKLDDPNRKSRQSNKTRGVKALTIRRPSVNTGVSGGTGVKY